MREGERKQNQRKDKNIKVGVRQGLGFALLHPSHAREQDPRPMRCRGCGLVEGGNDVDLVSRQNQFWEYALLGKYHYQKWEEGRWESSDAF